MSTLSLFGILRSAAGTNIRPTPLRTLLSVAKERQALKNLPAERLADIRYTPSQAKKEANRPL